MACFGLICRWTAEKPLSRQLRLTSGPIICSLPDLQSEVNLSTPESGVLFISWPPRGRARFWQAVDDGSDRNTREGSFVVITFHNFRMIRQTASCVKFPMMPLDCVDEKGRCLALAYLETMSAVAQDQAAKAGVKQPLPPPPPAFWRLAVFLADAGN